MFKRLFFTAVGLGAGLALGVYVVRKVDETQRRMRPEALAANAGARVDSIAGRVREALDEGRAAAAAREAELRATFGVRHRRGGPGEDGAAVERRAVAEWPSTAPTSE